VCVWITISAYVFSLSFYYIYYSNKHKGINPLSLSLVI
jgi:hypothetical protein